jgi:dTDP-4-amino-4,6-dideoxy-D-glucose acyltransferase
MRLLDLPGLRAHETARISEAASYYGNGTVIVGANSRIDHGCILTGDVTLGDYVHLAPYCVLYGKAGISIGNYSGFGAFTAMHSESDDYSGACMFGPNVPDEYRTAAIRSKIIIAPHVIGGTRVTILPGVSVAEGVSIGAHTLIKEDCFPWTIYAGTPAQALGPRRRENYLTLCRQFESSIGVDE